MDRQNNTADTPNEPAKTGSANCLPIGTRVADFEITGVIGEGGFGIVYLAIDHSLQRMVAIKEYMPGAMAGRGVDKQVIVRSARHEATFATGLKSFINEARLLGQFDHPALIKVYRFWEENNTGYMAMRYYEGDTLKSVVTKSPELISEDWLKGMLKPILEALDALYRVQILHRDISPDNIMIQENGEAVLLDFGAARQVIGDITHELTVILKPGFAPIEQYAEDATMKQGPWTDIYSLCAVVYYLVSNKPPPTSVGRLMHDPIKPLATGEHAGYSTEFLTAIDRGLAVQPQDRPQTIEEFRKLLALALSVPQPVQQRPPAVAAVPEPADIPPLEIEKKAAPAIINAPTVSLIKSPAIGAPEKAPNRRLLAIASLAIVLVVGGVFAIGKMKPRGAQPMSPATSGATAAPAPTPLPPAQVQSTASSTVSTTEQVMNEETIAWETLRENKNPKQEDISDFIGKYPAGEFTQLARMKLAELKAKGNSNGVESIASKAAAGNTGTADPAVDGKPVKATGSVRLAIKPWGSVMVDGASKGVSPPLKRLTLTEGRHQVKIINPNFPPYVVEINVNNKKNANVEVDFSGGRK